MTSAIPEHTNLILLDRDGVINFDSSTFIKGPDEWRPLPGAMSAIAALQTQYLIAVCTNQSGVGRGLLDLATLDAIHDKLNQELVQAGGKPLNIYFCPHLPDAGCACRKPQPGLLLAAMEAVQVAPTHTVYVGDSTKDVAAAANAGCRAALVLTGNGAETKAALTRQAAGSTDNAPSIYQDLADFARWALAS